MVKNKPIPLGIKVVAILSFIVFLLLIIYPYFSGDAWNLLSYWMNYFKYNSGFPLVFLFILLFLIGGTLLLNGWKWAPIFQLVVSGLGTLSFGGAFLFIWAFRFAAQLPATFFDFVIHPEVLTIFVNGVINLTITIYLIFYLVSNRKSRNIAKD